MSCRIVSSFDGIVRYRSAQLVLHDSARCLRAARTWTKQLGQEFRVTLSRRYHHTRQGIPSRSPCFILEHPRTHAQPEETETVPYRGHKVVPPSAAGLLEALLPQIPSHAVGVIYMPQKISGIDADSKRPLSMALAKGATYVSRRRHLCSATAEL